MAIEMELGDEIPDWARNCPTGKQKFATAEDARQAYKVDNARVKRSRKSFKGTVHVYPCPQCTGFHYTHRTHTRRKTKYRRDWEPPGATPPAVETEQEGESA